MKHVVDTSVILRRVLGDAHMLTTALEDACASRLARVEISRSLQRLRLEGRIDDARLAALVHEATQELATLDVLELTPQIIELAAGPMPTIVKTLDSLHLATALAVRSSGSEVRFVTHDGQQARAAQALGLTVIGMDS